MLPYFFSRVGDCSPKHVAHSALNRAAAAAADDEDGFEPRRVDIHTQPKASEESGKIHTDFYVIYSRASRGGNFIAFLFCRKDCVVQILGSFLSEVFHSDSIFFQSTFDSKNNDSAHNTPPVFSNRSHLSHTLDTRWRFAGSHILFGHPPGGHLTANLFKDRARTDRWYRGCSLRLSRNSNTTTTAIVSDRRLNRRSTFFKVKESGSTERSSKQKRENTISSICFEPQFFGMEHDGRRSCSSSSKEDEAPAAKT